MGFKLKKVEDFKNEAEFLSYLSKLPEQFQKALIKSDFKICFEIMDIISNAYFEYTPENIAENLYKSPFLKYYKEFLVSDLFQNVKYKSNNMVDFMVLLINFSDANDFFNNELAKLSIMDWVISEILDGDYIQKLDDVLRKEMLLHLLNVVHNVTHTLQNLITNRLDHFQDFLVKLIDKCSAKGNEKMKLLATLILAYTVAGLECDQMKNLLNIGIHAVKFLIDMSFNLSDADKRRLGFPLKSILNGLRYLCATDELRKEFRNNNGLKFIVNQLNTCTDDKEIEPALEIVLHQLLDSSEVKKQFLTNFNIDEILKKHEKSKNNAIFRHCTDIRRITKPDEIVKAKKTTDVNTETKHKNVFKFDIFISYCHQNKANITYIREELLKHNFKIWFDEVNMGVELYDSMAKGIESSHIILIGASPVYKASANCKCEALYAKELNKKIIFVTLQPKFRPAGWLGFIKAGQLYFEITDKKNKLSELVEEVRKMISGIVDTSRSRSREREHGDDMKSSVKTTWNNQTNQKDSVRVAKILGWTKDDVKQWLFKNELQNYQSYFKEMNGSLILELDEVRMQSPQFFYSKISEEFHMNLSDILKLQRALKELWVINS